MLIDVFGSQNNESSMFWDLCWNCSLEFVRICQILKSKYVPDNFLTRRVARLQKFRFVEWRWKKSRITVKNQGFQAPTKCRFLSIDNWVPHMSCPFTGLKMFWAGSNFLCETKNSFTLQVSKCFEQVQIFCASHKHFVPDKKMICMQ